MRLGLDFDNTIVSYDALFHRVALEGGLVPPELPASKLSVRDHLRRTGREETWIEMQGYVYGARMAEAQAYPGVIECLRWARGAGIETWIVSHKTLHPFRGPQYDLHAAARQWIAAQLHDAGAPLVAPERIWFELTKPEKLQRIAALGCTAYVDDLPEILDDPGFPAGAERILFDPDGSHSAQGRTSVRSWAELTQWLHARRAIASSRA